jgi:hypothetical protein
MIHGKHPWCPGSMLTKATTATPFRVRETADWKNRAACLEAEMIKRGMPFEVIDWFEGQGRLPFE